MKRTRTQWIGVLGLVTSIASARTVQAQETVVKEIPGVTGQVLPNLVAVGAGVLFVADTKSHEVWKSDGTDAGTGRLVTPDANGKYTGAVQWLASTGSVGFIAQLGGGGANSQARAIVGTDLTADGTRIVREDASIAAPTPVALGGKLLFPSSGPLALWASDGTPAGTASLATVALNATSFVVAGDQAFFLGATTGSPTLWKTDGTGPGTTAIASVTPQLGAFSFDAVGPRIYFVANGSELRRWDLGAPTSELIKAFDTSALGLPNLHAVGTRACFAVANPGSTSDLWCTDGTAEGTKLVRKIAPTAFSRAGGFLYVVTLTDGFWRTDGTEAGTVQLLSPQQTVGLGYFTAAGRHLYFVRGSTEVWSTDGTAAGTARLPGQTAPFTGRSMGVASGFLYYGTASPSNGLALTRYPLLDDLPASPDGSSSSSGGSGEAPPSDATGGTAGNAASDGGGSDGCSLARPGGAPRGWLTLGVLGTLVALRRRAPRRRR